jgi:hypothetical protein
MDLYLYSPNVFMGWCLVKHREDPFTSVIKVKLSLCSEHHAMKAYWGSGGTAPHILDLGTRGR